MDKEEVGVVNAKLLKLKDVDDEEFQKHQPFINWLYKQDENGKMPRLDEFCKGRDIMNITIWEINSYCEQKKKLKEQKKQATEYPIYEEYPENKVYGGYQEEEIPSLSPISVKDLLAKDFKPLEFSVNNILPQGIFLFAGSPKIGKSWLMLDMCISVATGSNLWEYSTNKGSVLYLCLEDNYRRVKERILKNSNSDSLIENENLFIETSSRGISDGLVEQVREFINNNSNTRLIVIDTLEWVRNNDNKGSSMYQSDYKDMRMLREIIADNDITLILVHHTRKMNDPDPLNTLSGSTGLTGSVDGNWVLAKQDRAERFALLHIVNRDTPQFCFLLNLNEETCQWDFIQHYVADKEISPNDDELCKVLDLFLSKAPFNGGARKLKNQINEFIEIQNKKLDKDSKIGENLNLSERTLNAIINRLSDKLNEDYNIHYNFKATGKEISLTKIVDEDILLSERS